MKMALIKSVFGTGAEKSGEEVFGNVAKILGLLVFERYPQFMRLFVVADHVDSAGFN